MSVQQRYRRRLPAGHLPVGVVADQCPIGDGAVEPLLGRRDPSVELLGRVLYVVVERLELLLQGGRVANEVAVPVPKHGPLVRPQPTQLERQDQAGKDRDDRHRHPARATIPTVLFRLVTRGRIGGGLPAPPPPPSGPPTGT